MWGRRRGLIHPGLPIFIHHQGPAAPPHFHNQKIFKFQMNEGGISLKRNLIFYHILLYTSTSSLAMKLNVVQESFLLQAIFCEAKTSQKRRKQCSHLNILFIFVRVRVVYWLPWVIFVCRGGHQLTTLNCGATYCTTISVFVKALMLLFYFHAFKILLLATIQPIYSLKNINVLIKVLSHPNNESGMSYPKNVWLIAEVVWI